MIRHELAYLQTNNNEIANTELEQISKNATDNVVLRISNLFKIWWWHWHEK